jgi:hypothetical protein
MRLDNDAIQLIKERYLNKEVYIKTQNNFYHGTLTVVTERFLAIEEVYLVNQIEEEQDATGKAMPGTVAYSVAPLPVGDLWASLDTVDSFGAAANGAKQSVMRYKLRKDRNENQETNVYDISELVSAD